MEPRKEANKKKFIGVVVKDKMEKTVVVETERSYKHPIYQKHVRTKKRYNAHDNENKCRIGDKVLIVETRPVSKGKKWLVKDIIKKEELALVPEELIEEVIKDDTGQN